MRLFEEQTELPDNVYINYLNEATDLAEYVDKEITSATSALYTEYNMTKPDEEKIKYLEWFISAKEAELTLSINPKKDTKNTE